MDLTGGTVGHTVWSRRAAHGTPLVRSRPPRVPALTVTSCPFRARLGGVPRRRLGHAVAVPGDVDDVEGIHFNQQQTRSPHPEARTT